VSADSFDDQIQARVKSRVCQARRLTQEPSAARQWKRRRGLSDVVDQSRAECLRLRNMSNPFDFSKTGVQAGSRVISGAMPVSLRNGPADAPLVFLIWFCSAPVR